MQPSRLLPLVRLPRVGRRTRLLGVNVNVTGTVNRMVTKITSTAAVGRSAGAAIIVTPDAKLS